MKYLKIIIKISLFLQLLHTTQANYARNWSLSVFLFYNSSELDLNINNSASRPTSKTFNIIKDYLNKIFDQTIDDVSYLQSKSSAYHQRAEDINVDDDVNNMKSFEGYARLAIKFKFKQKLKLNQNFNNNSTNQTVFKYSADYFIEIIFFNLNDNYVKHIKYINDLIRQNGDITSSSSISETKKTAYFDSYKINCKLNSIFQNQYLFLFLSHSSFLIDLFLNNWKQIPIFLMQANNYDQVSYLHLYTILSKS